MAARGVLRALTTTRLTKGNRRASVLQLVAEGESSDAVHLTKTLERDKKGLNKQDEFGRTPLHVAIETLQLNVIDLLVVANRKMELEMSLMDNRGRTPLHAAVKTGRTDVVQRIVDMSKQVADGQVDFPGPNDRTPLHLAVSDNHLGIVKILLENGGNPLMQDKEGMTPAGVAAVKGFVTVLDIMFRIAEAEGSVFTTSQLLDSTTGTHHQHASLLHLAVHSQSAEIVAYLIQKRIDMQARLINGSTAMHVACIDGSLLMVQLLAANPWLIHAANFNNVTPLHEAARNDHCHILKYLLEQGANPEVMTMEGLTGLLVASEFGALDAVKLFMNQKVNVLALDEKRCTILHHAIGHARVLEQLTRIIDPDTLSELIDFQDAEGHTALHYAACRGNTSNVRILLSHGAQVDVQDNHGVSPLAVAAARGLFTIVEMLVDLAPRSVNEKDSHGRSPLHVCCKRGHVRIADYLIHRGASLFPDHDGRTPLHYSAEGGSVKCLSILLSNFRGTVDMVDCEKCTALHMAAHYNHPQVVTFFLDNGAELTDNDNCQNPLDVAIADNHKLCALAFVSHERWRKAMKSITADNKIQLKEMVVKMPDVAQAVLDRCVITTTNEHTDQMVTYDFTYLQGVTSEKEEIPFKHSLGALDAMVSFNRSQCLSHSLCVTFLNAKWMRFVAFLSIGNLFSYVVYVLLLSWVVITYSAYGPLSFLNNPAGLVRMVNLLKHLKEENKTDAAVEEIYKFCYDDPLRWFLVASALLGLGKELVPFLYQGMVYIKRLSNLIEVVVYILTLLFLDPLVVMVHRLEFDPPCPRIFWEAGAVAIFLAWLNLLLHVRRLPRIGMYVVMMVSMVRTMLKVLVVVALFVVAFGLAFYMLMSSQPSFTTSGISMMKTVVMMVGDLDYSTVLPVSTGNHTINQTELCRLVSQLRSLTEQVFPPDVIRTRQAEIDQISCTSNITMPGEDESGNSLPFPTLSAILFVTFNLLMIVVVLNVLIGLAVGDINSVQKDAAMRQLRMQVQLIIDLENALPAWLLKRFKFYKVVKCPAKDSRLKRFVAAVLRAAHAPKDTQNRTIPTRIQEIRLAQQHLEDWLKSLSHNLDKQKDMLKQLAVIAKRTDMKTQEQQPQTVHLPIPSVVRVHPDLLNHSQEVSPIASNSSHSLHEQLSVQEEEEEDYSD